VDPRFIFKSQATSPVSSQPLLLNPTYLAVTLFFCDSALQQLPVPPSSPHDTAGAHQGWNQDRGSVLHTPALQNWRRPFSSEENNTHWVACCISVSRKL